jgi:phospholipid/cholesterol/gamma-HCH transport system substrate-binding protein
MPSGSGINIGLRVLVISAIVLAVGVAGWMLLRGGGGGYTVSITLPNANQLVKGNQVKVGGVTVGTVDELKLTGDGRARIVLTISDDGLAPLPKGTKATIRSTSLSGIASRYVALTLTDNKEEIEDGGSIPDADVRAQVDLDEVLNTLDPQTQKDLAESTRAGARIFDDGAAKLMNEGLHKLNPALSQAGITESEILRDQAQFEKFLVQSAQVVEAVASRSDEIPTLVSGAHATMQAVANQSDHLESSLSKLPPTLRQTNTTLVDLRSAIADLRPTVRLAQPVAPLLTDFLTDLQPTARQARPVLADLRNTIDSGGNTDLLGVLNGLGPVADKGVPAMKSAVSTVEDALPVVRELRPYTPDLVGGLLNGFGGTTMGHYDANGHFGRISFHSSVYSGQGLGSFLPVPNASDGLLGFRRGVTERCPGAAVEPLADGSNPYIEDPKTCTREGTR